MPVLAQNVVATSQPLAAQAGLRMLLRGGNAVDAALATAITLTVVEPTSNGIGSDAFALVWDGDYLHGLNASGHSPAAWSPEVFAGLATMPLTGWNAVTVPGAVSAWSALSQRFGQLPFPDLFEPAIEYARNGFLVSPITATSWQQQAKVFQQFPEFVAAFMPGGRAPQVGEKFAFPDQAKTLELIATTGGEAFYRGELATKIVAHAQANGGLMTREDLAAHEPAWVEPIAQSYRDYALYEIPPNGQGLAALLMLGILQQWPMADYPVDSAASLHLQIEAMKLALADAHRYIADTRNMDMTVSHLLDPDYLAQRAALIDMKQAQQPSFGVPQRGGTVLLSAADARGMMVSFIQSNYHGFGSGIVVPGTGISLQNRGYGFNLIAGHPNQVAGRKRPFHTIIPAFATHNGKPAMSFGMMGGAMQTQGHAQMMIRLADYHQNPQTASDAPRWQVMGGLEVAVEAGFKPEVLRDLMARGHHITQHEAAAFGGAQLIYKLEDGYMAASDHRKDGQAVGF
ncbi:MAG: gamma-glutamyltransferase family protein [Abitibacteriaceae bacterium]|nr:gamma-glutamyltransferase family protein [Abditibacteriaceae bacterium]